MPLAIDHEPYKAINGKDEPCGDQVRSERKAGSVHIQDHCRPVPGQDLSCKGDLRQAYRRHGNLQQQSRKSLKSWAPCSTSGERTRRRPISACRRYCCPGKLQFTKTGDTLCEKNNIVKLPPVDSLSRPCTWPSKPSARARTKKMASGLHKLMEEDPSFVLTRNSETRQTLIGGQGDIQLGIVMSKLKDKYGVTVKTIPSEDSIQRDHKGYFRCSGQTQETVGGAGQYGDVHIRFSPSQQEFEFSEELFGGSVPKQYVPAVERDCWNVWTKGPLAGAAK